MVKMFDVENNHEILTARFLEFEARSMQSALRNLSGPNVLVLGDFFNLNCLQPMDFPNIVVMSTRGHVEGFSLAADSAFLPFENKSFASVVMPHVVEKHRLPHQVLREAHRVLQADGSLLLTCFNPRSLLGIQHLARNTPPFCGQYYALPRMKEWLSVLGFELVGGAMYHYAPLLKSNTLTRRLAFLNVIGDRWFPMFGGGYFIHARKRETGSYFVGRTRAYSRKARRPMIAGASACRSIVGPHKIDSEK